MQWWRSAPALGIFILLEVVDNNVDAFSFPWWLSLLMSLFLSVFDIILIAIIDACSTD